jgi:hypothetical protein
VSRAVCSRSYGAGAEVLPPAPCSGDIVPQTAAGKCVDSAAMVVGVLCMAMPIAIVGSAFTRVWEERQVERRTADAYESRKEGVGEDAVNGAPHGLRQDPSVSQRLGARSRLRASSGSEQAGVEDRLWALEQSMRSIQAASLRTEAAMRRVEAVLLGEPPPPAPEESGALAGHSGQSVSGEQLSRALLPASARGAVSKRLSGHAIRPLHEETDPRGVPAGGGGDRDRSFGHV